MAENSRRNFLKSIALVGGTSLAGIDLLARESEFHPEAMSVLVDIGVCVGCRNCEHACKEAHNLPLGNCDGTHGREVFKEFRRPCPDALTVVNEFPNEENSLLPYNVKYQCMHCNDPACVSACIVGAFEKTKHGAVVWDSGKCIGCRYCMVACPFQVPTFEYEEALKPDISKCDFCYDRTSKGALPACVQSCPVEALTYGTRTEILRLARKRIERNPDKYIDKVYGEVEVGGTSWLYIAPKEFEEYKFPTLGEAPAPGVTEAIQHGIFAYFIPPIALFAWLGGVMWMNKRKKEITASLNEEEEESHE
jgi:formate dehydrogenase iron-sulfur subunit